jgi:hypothetical protein
MYRNLRQVSPLPPIWILDAKALKLDNFTVAMMPAAAKSEAWFACDKDNLYIGLRA